MKEFLVLRDEEDPIVFEAIAARPEKEVVRSLIHPRLKRLFFPEIMDTLIEVHGPELKKIEISHILRNLKQYPETQLKALQYIPKELYKDMAKDKRTFSYEMRKALREMGRS